MDNIEKIYDEARSEIERIKAEQAVRLEKINALAAELGLTVDANLMADAEYLRDKALAEKKELETQLEQLLEELKKTE